MSTFDFTPGPKPGKRPPYARPGAVQEKASGGVSFRSSGLICMGFLLITGAVFFFISAGRLFGESGFASLVIDLAIVALLIGIPVCYMGCVLMVTDTAEEEEQDAETTTGQPTLFASGVREGATRPKPKRRPFAGVGFCILFLFLVSVVVFGITIIVDLGGATDNGELVGGVVAVGLVALFALCYTFCACAGWGQAPVLE